MAAYLLERIAEDEQAAREAAARDAPTWLADDTGEVYSVRDVNSPDRCGQHPPRVPNMCDDLLVADAADVTDDPDVIKTRGEHVARWDPFRVLTECTAKRRVVEHCLEVLTHHVYGDWGATDMAEEVLRLLVQVHADRPDFPAEWLPEVAW